MDIVYQMPPAIMGKVNHLSLALKKARAAYERLAAGLQSHQLRQTLIALAQESRQYAHELDMMACSMGAPEEKQEPLFPADPDSPEGAGDREIVRWCARSERSILVFYRELLNEPYLLEGIRKMARYQQNGLMHSFAQLKMLNASLRRS